MKRRGRTQERGLGDRVVPLCLKEGATAFPRFRVCSEDSLISFCTEIW